MYLEGLDKHNLRVGIWSGNIVLENLRIKSNLFDNVKLPFFLKFGKIKLLKILVPWTRLSSSPVEIVMESLMLIVGPQRKEDWQVIDQSSFEFKKMIIDEFVATLVTTLKVQIAQKKESKEEGYMDRLLNKIVDNIQVTVRNIHVRYEDSHSYEKNPFSLGFTLKALNINTTNGEWEPHYYDRTLAENKDKPIFKKLKIESFATYVQEADTKFLCGYGDHHQKHVSKESKLDREQDEEEEKGTIEENKVEGIDEEEVERKMSEMFPLENDLIENVSYLVHPLMLEIKLVQLTKPEVDKPMFKVDIALGQLVINLRKQQYEVIIKFADYLRQYLKFNERFNMPRKYKHMRPIFPVFYKDSYVLNMNQRSFKERYSLPLPTIKKNQEQKGSSLMTQESKEGQDGGEDQEEDEFFDALDEQLPIQGADNPSQEDEIKVPEQQIVIDSQYSNYNAVEWWRYSINCMIRDIRTRNGQWNQFKISIWKKRQYGRLLIKLVNKCLSGEYQIQYETLQEEERLLYNHIITANDLEDLKSWISILVKAKLQKAFEEQERLANQSKDGLFSYLFSWGIKKEEVKDESSADQVQQIDTNSEDQNREVWMMSEEEMEQIRQSLAETQFFDINEVQMSSEEKKKLVKFHIHCVFEKGQLLLEEQQYCIELFHENLKINLEVKRDASYELNVTNQNIGINVLNRSSAESLTFDTVKPLVKKLQAIQQSDLMDIIEEHAFQQNDESIIWSLKIHKNDLTSSNIAHEIAFESNPLKIVYDAEAVYQIISFFKLDQTEEIRARALNKLAAFKASTQLSLQDLFYKKQNLIKVQIRSPILVIPFKAHNSALIGEAEGLRDRMWSLNLGNINLESNNVQGPEGVATSVTTDMNIYEKLLVTIDSVSLQYFKQETCIRVLEEIQINLEISIKNKMKQTILQGANEEKQNDKEHDLAEVYINASLPDFKLNLTPDVYNGLVNIKEVLISVGVEEELVQLKQEKDQIFANSSVSQFVATRGVRNYTAYWQEHFVVLSGSYLYFYKDPKELMPYHYIYIMNCKAISKLDQTDWSKIQSEQLDIKHTLILKSKNEKLYLSFSNLSDKNNFIDKLISKQHEIKGDNGIVLQNDVISDIIHKDQKDLGFCLTLNVQNISLRIFNSTEEAFKIQSENSQDKQWICARIEKVHFSLFKLAYEIQLRFKIESILMRETEVLNEDILINEVGQNSCELDIDVYTIYSPNIEDVEIDVKLRLGQIVILYEPLTINKLAKFFRNVKSEALKDVECFKLALMNDEKLNQRDVNISSEKQKIFQQSCKTIGITLVAFQVSSTGVEIICVHHEYFSPFLGINVRDFEFKYKQMYDHDVVEGLFGNIVVQDLTNYPSTIIPEKDYKATIKTRGQFYRREIVGLRESPAEFDEDKKGHNNIKFTSMLFTDNCPLHKPQTLSSLHLEIAETKILYCYELSFRIIDYFFDKFLWALTESDPYESLEAKQQKNQKIDISEMTVSQLEEFDLKQDTSQMDLEVLIHRPYVIIKDRPYNDDALEVDLGEIRMFNEQRVKLGRFLKAPEKIIYLTSLIIDAKDLSIKYTKDQSDYEVAPPFDLKLDFAYLNRSPLLGNIDSSLLDKSYSIQMDLTPTLKLNLTQEIYTFFCKCMDLNFAYTDSYEEKFIFRNEEDYFKSTAYLLKSRMKIDVPILALGLFDKKDLLTEILFKNTSFLIDYHLNRRQNYDIKIDQASMFYLKNLSQKQLLFGNLMHKHKIPINQSYEETFENNQAKILNNCQVQILMQMYPTGDKDFQIKVNQLKIFLQPYFYLMLDHFFREGLPVYNMDSFDKPNEYDSDYETYPELHTTVYFKDSLICLAHEAEKLSKIVACRSNVEYEFKRENIKSVKKQIIQLIEAKDSIPDDEDKEVGLPYSWMRLQFFEFCPFLCEAQDLEVYEFAQTRKRQIIAPFALSYFYARYLKYQLHSQKLINYEKSEITTDKTLVKISYNDLRLLIDISSKLTQGYEKFNQFYVAYKKVQQEIQPIHISDEEVNQINTFKVSDKEEVHENLDNIESILQSNIYRTASKTLDFLTYGTIVRQSNVGGVTINNSDLHRKESALTMQNNNQMSQKNYLYEQRIDYDVQDCKIFRFQSSGLQIVIINDYNNVFYPVLSINIQNFQFKQQIEFDKTIGETLLKGMISYYNPQAGEWEPLIEKSRIHLQIEQRQNRQRQVLLSFKKNLNINITDILMQTLIQTYQSLQEKEREGDQGYSTNRDTSHHSMHQKVSDNQLNLHSEQFRMNHQNRIEFKVTPYTIVNYTSKMITVKRIAGVVNHQKKHHELARAQEGEAGGSSSFNSQMPKEYIIMPGESVDYEVDYEEEARQLMRITRDELIRKHDFISATFETHSGQGYMINEINLRDTKHYRFDLDEASNEYIAYGVTFENMRKILTFRAPYTINNMTGFEYKLKLIDYMGKKEHEWIEVIETLKPGECYPVGVEDLNKKFSICNATNSKDQWSNPIKIITVIERLPKNTTTYIYHGKQFSIIIKEKTQFSRTYNINIKSPLIMKNCLPCNLRIKTNTIKDAYKVQKQGSHEEDTEFLYQQETFFIEKGQSMMFYNFNLKETIYFQFTLDLDPFNSEDDQQVQSFAWTEALIKNTEFKKTTKIFQVRDSQAQTNLDVYLQMKNAKNSGVQITIFVKNCIINNTNQVLQIYYDKKTPVAGQKSNENSIILLSDRSKVMACIQEEDQTMNFSNQFQIDVMGATNTIQIRRDAKMIYEFTVNTELSLASADDDIYTKVTTISPSYVLNNKTKRTILVTQEDCLDVCQIVQAGQRVPFFLRDLKKRRAIKIKCIESEYGEYDDQTHDWSYGLSLQEIGRVPLLNRSMKSLNSSKHIVVDRALQQQNQITYVTFEEESLLQSTYLLENKTAHLQIEYCQKDYPQNGMSLKPKESHMFSWTNPDAEFKITCKISLKDSNAQMQEIKLDIEPDNLDLNQKIELPPQYPTKWIYVSTRTNGYSKILRFADKSLISQNEQDKEELKANERWKRKLISSFDQFCDGHTYPHIELKESEQGETIVPRQTIHVQVGSIGVSLICRTYQGLRREFLYMDFQNLKFLIIQTDKQIEIQMKVAYFQVDNNISDKQIFPIMLYPKELLKRREQLKKEKIMRAANKKEEAKQGEKKVNKDFFNIYFSLRNDFQNVIFFEKIEFLVQTMILQMDDELIGFIFKFTNTLIDQMHTNITGVHEVFKVLVEVESSQEPHFMIEVESSMHESPRKTVVDPEIFFQDLPLQNEDESKQPGFEALQVNKPRIDKSMTLKKSKTNKESDFLMPVKSPLAQSTMKHQEQNQNFMAFIGGDNMSSHTPSARLRETQQTKGSLMSSNAYTQINKSSWLNYKVEQKDKNLYIKEYKSSPLEIEVSFLTRVKMDIDLADKKFSLKDKFKVFGLALSNMDQAPLRINSLIISNVFGTPSEVIILLKSHYVERMKKNIGAMIGSSNILGNPHNFVSHLGTGVQDFFYKPIDGMVKGPLEGGKGLIEGTGSLLKNTVQGTFGSTSKMLSSVSKGLLFITDDTDYINKREEDNLDRPKNALEGVGYGLKSTFTGIASGLTGVFEQPIKGAQKDGVKGFFVGSYKGMSGLVVKPLSGALDFFAKTSEGIKNTASSGDVQVSKIRILRPFYGKLQLIKSYDNFHAIICQHFRKINRGKYVNDHFIDALYYDTERGERQIIVLTEERLVTVNSNTKEVIAEFESTGLSEIKKTPNMTLVIYLSQVNSQSSPMMEQEALRLQIVDSVRYDRYYKKLKNYIVYIKSDQ